MTHDSDQPSPASVRGDEHPHTVRLRKRLLLAAVGAIAIGVGSLPSLNASASSSSSNSAKITAIRNTGAGRYQDMRTAPLRSDAKALEGVDNYLARTDTHRVKHSADTRIGAAPSAPIVHGPNFNGTNENQSGSFPPDNDISVGKGNIVQVTNFAVTVFKKSGTLVSRTNFATFFGTSSEFIFDPRTYYDPYWQRFVISADGQTGSGSTGNSFFWVAISTSSNPAAGYFIYHFGIGTPTGDFLDFPQLGMDQDSIILTVNDLQGNGGFDAKVFALPKAPMYSGMGTGFSVFGGSGCTISPPYVLDNNPKTFLLTACPNDNRLFLGAMTNSSRSNVSVLLWQAIISVPGFTSAPTAPQPGVSYALETNTGNSFENRSYQVGDQLMNVHTIAVGTATPKWYDINTATNSVTNSGIWFATGSSSDWRPHLALNSSGEVFGTWMSVDAPNNINLQVRFTGGTGFTTPNGAGTLYFQSTQPLTGQTFPAGRNRTGDYGSVALDPSSYSSTCFTNRRVYVAGETVAGANEWGSRIARIGNC